MSEFRIQEGALIGVVGAGVKRVAGEGFDIGADDRDSVAPAETGNGERQCVGALGAVVDQGDGEVGAVFGDHQAG